MSALWEDYTTTFGLTAVSAAGSSELFHNEVDDHIFASAPITVVDGIATFIGDTDDLCRIKLVVAHESFVAADIEALGSHEDQNWYRWFVARGPLVYRIRSKRTIPPEHKLWATAIKSQGANPTDVHMGLSLLLVRHQ